MVTVTITGGTGLIGRALSKALLDKGYSVIILTRKQVKENNRGNISYASWDTDKQLIDETAIKKADYIVHLAGAGVADKRWTKKRKQQILESRVNSSALIVRSLKAIDNNVKAVISASAIGWYGPDKQAGIGNENKKSKFKETDPASSEFLGSTCLKWEQSIEPVTEIGRRLVRLRTGIVLSNDGGALIEFCKPLKFGIAAILGNGKQVMSWIHIRDLVNMYIAAIENNNMHGAYNAVSSNPVSNKEMVLTLARIKRKYFIPFYVPAFVLKVVIGEMSIEVLKSSTVSNEKILSTGFTFGFDQINHALKDLFK